MGTDLINTSGKLNDNHYYKWLLKNYNGGILQNYRKNYLEYIGVNDGVPTEKQKILQTIENYFYLLNIKNNDDQRAN